MTKVKICGITNRDDALAACDAGADALGFVFAEEARARNRYIAPEDAKDIIEALPPWVITVAVVVNAPLALLQKYLQFVDRIQLHGEEPDEITRALGHRAIKAFRAGPEFSIMALQQCPAPAVLLDAYDPERRGGTGKTADWSLARQAAALGKALILAGGLTPENVAEAVRTVRPYAVDTSGGVESAPGKKDHERIRSFIHNAKTSLP